MASPGRKWVWNHGKIWKKMSELPVQSYLSLVTEIGSRFAGSKSELISGASSSAVKFCRMISSVFWFFCNSLFSRTVAACSDSRFSILFWIFSRFAIFNYLTAEPVRIPSRLPVVTYMEILIYRRASLDKCFGVFTLLRVLARRIRTFSSL